MDEAEKTLPPELPLHVFAHDTYEEPEWPSGLLAFREWLDAMIANVPAPLRDKAQIVIRVEHGCYDDFPALDFQILVPAPPKEPDHASSAMTLADWVNARRTTYDAIS